ncbi:MAG TPA: family 20 glycosylhydrolase [Armatimonadota bacterium]
MERGLQGMLAALCLVVAVMAVGAAEAKQETKPWCGVHLMIPNPKGLPLLKRAIAEVMAPLGINVLVLEVDYSFDYKSHPEVKNGTDVITKEQARDLAALCKEKGVRLIPQFQCLGHQSWDKFTGPLLTQHPEFDETPQIPKDNPKIYCRSWCPLHPDVNPLVFDLMDELIDAFKADALHVGMDEVFLIASDQCPRCRGKKPADLFAKAVLDYHQHLVKKRKVTMLMWGDRLLDDATMGYGEWESSNNGTAGALSKLPKDIVMCDWHYELRQDYPSIAYFQKQGFRVWPSTWKDVKAAQAQIDCAYKSPTAKMLGELFTTWCSTDHLCRALLGETDPSLKDAQPVAETLRKGMERLKSMKR